MPLVVAMDQPLFAKAKLIQWAWPEKYGETQFVFVFGSLHIEQAFSCESLVNGLNTVDGKVCWYKPVFIQKVNACIKISHIKKTVYLLQVTAASLDILLEEVFEEHGERVAF